MLQRQNDRNQLLDLIFLGGMNLPHHGLLQHVLSFVKYSTSVVLNVSSSFTDNATVMKRKDVLATYLGGNRVWSLVAV